MDDKESEIRKNNSPSLRFFPQEGVVNSGNESSKVPANLMFSFPSEISTPTQNIRYHVPLFKGNEFACSVAQTPSLRERISPFSFKGEGLIDRKNQCQSILKGPHPQANKLSEHKPCNCKITNCSTTKCKCKKLGVNCQPDCKCRMKRCANMRLDSSHIELSFRSEMKKESEDGNQRELKTIRCSDELFQKREDEPVILFNKKNRRVVIQKSEKIKPVHRKTPAKVYLSQRLKKFNL